MFQSILYVEIDVFAALVLLTIMDRGRSILLTEEQRLFKAELLSVVAVLLFDSATWGLNGTSFPGARLLNLAANYLYWAASLLPCYIGLMYCSLMVFRVPSRRRALLYALPLFAGEALLLLNFGSGWIFAVDGGNVYARGPYFLAVGIMPVFHMTAGAILTLRQFFRAPAYERKKFLMLTFFMILPLLGAVLQALFYGLVTIWIGLTLSLLMCHVYLQNANLSADPLTGLNNHGRFDSYSAWKFRAMKDADSLCLVVLDIDRFKDINDTFGHREGDRALVRAANVLRQAVGSRRGLLARIGGDEFAVLLDGRDAEEAGSLVEEIRELLRRENEASEKKYRLSFSIGCACVHGRDRTEFSKLFTLADQRMYEEKRGKKLSADGRKDAAEDC